jgi:hypothetical protein
MSYRAAFTAMNDWVYFNRLLSFQWVAKRHTTKGYCWALINVAQSKGCRAEYKWWKLNRKTYKLLK